MRLKLGKEMKFSFFILVGRGPLGLGPAFIHEILFVLDNAILSRPLLLLPVCIFLSYLSCCGIPLHSNENYSTSEPVAKSDTFVNGGRVPFYTLDEVRNSGASCSRTKIRWFRP